MPSSRSSRSAARSNCRCATSQALIARSDVLGGHGWVDLTCAGGRSDRRSVWVVSRTTPRGAPRRVRRRTALDVGDARLDLMHPSIALSRSPVSRHLPNGTGRQCRSQPCRNRAAEPASAPRALRRGTGPPRRRSPGRDAARPRRRRARSTRSTGSRSGRRARTSSRNASTSGLTVCRIASRSIGRSHDQLDAAARAPSSGSAPGRPSRPTPSLTAMIGLTDSSVPIAAWAPLIRPPFLRYSSVSRATYMRRSPVARLERARRSRRPGRPRRRARRPSGRGSPAPSTRPANRRRGSRGRAACRGRSGRS